MLWKKESERSDAMYEDICDDLRVLEYRRPVPENQYETEVRTVAGLRSNITSSTNNKNDSIALQKRLKGNELFGKGKWSDAIEMYNESLCFAEPKSALISLAYANRSSCFFKLKQYNECLIDIELAIEAGYPDDLMPKMEKRKSLCLECIEIKEQTCAYEPKLSFEPNETFPCLANVVDFQGDVNGKWAVVAKEDIAVNQTIAIEEAFTTCLHMRYGSQCTFCLKSDTNLTPCKKCTIAMFCSDECQSNIIHEYECGVNFTRKVENTRIVRSILKAINMFSNADELIKFVEETRNSISNEVPTSLTDAKLNYRSFLKSPFNLELSAQYLGLMEVYPVYTVLLDIPKISEMFNTQQKRRFVMHLIGQHALITQNHSINTSLGEMDSIAQCGYKQVTSVLYSLTGVIYHYFSHSCAPNVISNPVNNKIVYYTLRPIKKGETLQRSWDAFSLEPKEIRQEVLLQRKQITCKCERCDGPTATELQRKQMASDPDYIFIQEKMLKLTSDSLQVFIDKCVSFLIKYGRMTWCKEIGEMVITYRNLKSLQSSGIIHNLPESLN